MSTTEDIAQVNDYLASAMLRFVEGLHEKVSIDTFCKRLHELTKPIYYADLVGIQLENADPDVDIYVDKITFLVDYADAILQIHVDQSKVLPVSPDYSKITFDVTQDSLVRR